MIRYLSVGELLVLHRQVVQRTGGAEGIRDLGALQSAVAQPRTTFSGQELYPSISEKAAALGFSLIMNHPFIDGNKRVGHAAMEVFLYLNGYEIDATVDEQEAIILSLAAGELKRTQFLDWVRTYSISRR